MKDCRIKLSIGENRFSTNWTNTEMLFSEFCEKINKPVRTNETVEQYCHYSPKQRTQIKDVGGYIGGWLDTDRKKDSVVCRSVWTADIDNMYEEIFRTIDLRVDYRCVIHSTHTHTEDNPRLRIIAPFDREVTPEEYPIIAEYLANRIDIDYGGEASMFDKSATRVNQMMYWPSCSVDGEYFYKSVDGNLIEVDHILESIEENRRIFYSTFVEPEKKTESKPLLKQKKEPSQLAISNYKVNKLDNKSRLIKLFCNIYTVKEVIEQYLSDIYEPTTDPTRYTYIDGSADGGLLINTDLNTAFSFHSSDTANTSHMLNPFDLIAIHKYSNSVIETLDKCIRHDPNIKLYLMKEKFDSVKLDYSNWKDLNWLTQLEFDTSGNLKDTTENVICIMENDPRINHFGYNQLSHCTEVTGQLPWNRPINCSSWRDSDDNSLKRILSRDYIEFNDRHYYTAFTNVSESESRSFNPIKQYLDNLPKWDNIPRVETLLINTMKADDNEYVRAVTRKTLVAAISRIYTPGIKFDSVLVLDGMQGIGKSTLFKDLVGDKYYSDSLTLTDMIDKTAAEKLQGNWIVEVAELAGMRKTEIEKVKSFITSTDDRYRPSYGIRTENHPRQCIIIATVNGERGYLRDITGNRRFWIVKLHQQKQYKSWNFSKYDIDQIWAEAKYYYENGEKLYLEGNVLRMAEEAQIGALEVDERSSIVKQYLDRLLPVNWKDMSLEERRSFLNDERAYLCNHYGTVGEVEREDVCIMEIWCECFGKDKTDFNPKRDSRAISVILKSLGWEPTHKSKYTRLYYYVKTYAPKV